MEGNSALESQAILLDALSGDAAGELVRPAAQRLLETQLPQGGWAAYPAGQPDASLSIQAYFALKLAGEDPASEPLDRARRTILTLGGADMADGPTRFWLALLGQIPYAACPVVSPQIALGAPGGRLDGLGAGGLGVGTLGTSSKMLLVALSIVSARQPVHRIDLRRGVRELFVAAPDQWQPCPVGGGSGRDRFYRFADRLLSYCQRRRLVPLGRRAIRVAETWLIRQLSAGGDLPGYAPAFAWTLAALKALGYADENPEVSCCRQRLEASIVVVHRGPSPSIRVQPCQLPLVDTAIALRALNASGIRGDHPAILSAADWLLAQQTRGWSTTGQGQAETDANTSALVLMALQDPIVDPPGEKGEQPPDLRLFDDRGAAADWSGSVAGNTAVQASSGTPDAASGTASASRDALVMHVVSGTAAIDGTLGWLLAQQNDDGGWGTGERTSRRRLSCGVRRLVSGGASASDSTGRVLEALGKLGYGLGCPAVNRAVAYLRRRQEPDGSWFGRGGVNYIYGTWQVLAGLARVGLPGDDPSVAAGANWLLSRQQLCGGWGESPASYADPRRRGQGEPTASQTAWALMGLLAAGLEAHPAVARAVQYLVDTQSDDGTWAEEPFTGTGLPGTTYLRHHYYPLYFPLLALAQWAATAAATQATVAAPALRVIMPPSELGGSRAVAGL